MVADVAGHVGMFMPGFLDMINMMDMMSMVRRDVFVLRKGAEGTDVIFLFHAEMSGVF